MAKANITEFQNVLPDGYLYDWTSNSMGGKSGIGISKDRKQIVLWSAGKLKTYSVENIRGHQIINEKAGEIIGGGITGAMKNIGMTMAAARATGFYIRVKDIENPRWRLTISQEEDQDRWDEILLQLYEGILR